MVPTESTKTENVSIARIPFLERVTCTVAEACEATGLGRTKLYALLAEGCLESTTVGRRRLIDVRSLKQLLKPHR
jgi:excisionase family DNA binding protein